jgi:hypothetical protein
LKRNPSIIIGLSLILSACGPQAIPTADPVQMEASAVAMANTFVAETQAAIPPTSTPTDTPVPSPTPMPTSTEAPVATVVEASPTALADSCNRPFFDSPVAAPGAGKVDNGANIIIINSTKVSVTVSLYLSKNKFGQCGYVSYVLPRKQSVIVMNVLPYGCYSASAYVNDPKKPSNPSGGPTCITGPDRTTFTISAEQIKITGP